MATVTQADGAHVDRRVYVNEDERLFVKINGDFVAVFFLTTHGRDVAIWKA
jgi:hypothetical protein